MKEYQNYLFDLYGTLIDIHTDEEQPLLWQRLAILLGTEGNLCTAEELRKAYSEEVVRLEAAARQQRGAWAEIDIAPVFSRLYRLAGVEAGEEQVRELAKLFRIFSLEKLRLFPGATEMLQRLRAAGKKVYLLSNAQALFTLPELKALDLERYFDGIVISSEAGLKKPDTGLYRLAMERYGLSAADTVMVGNDDQADCHGASKAGLDSMYVFTEQSPKRTEPLPDNCRRLTEIGEVYP